MCRPSQWQTHDDITYPSLAKAFNLPLTKHQRTLDQMAEMSKGKYDFNAQTPEQRAARERMAELPTGEGAEALHVEAEKWVVRSRNSLIRCRVWAMYFLLFFILIAETKGHVLYTSLLLPLSSIQQPVVRLKGRLCVFPGIPGLFTSLLV